MWSCSGRHSGNHFRGLMQSDHTDLPSNSSSQAGELSFTTAACVTTFFQKNLDPRDLTLPLPMFESPTAAAARRLSCMSQALPQQSVPKVMPRRKTGFGSGRTYRPPNQMTGRNECLFFGLSKHLIFADPSRLAIACHSN